jgi:4-carboxymuconolactone decarboxylase
MAKRAASSTGTATTAPASGAEQQTVKRIAPPEVYQVAPALGAYTDKVVFGEVWSRAQLAPRDRSLITLSALTAQGKMPQVSRT